MEIGYRKRALDIFVYLIEKSDKNCRIYHRVWNEHKVIIVPKNDDQIANREKKKTHIDDHACADCPGNDSRNAKKRRTEKLERRAREQNSGRELNKRIFPRNIFFAVAASAVKYDKTQKRNVVLPANIVLAKWTMRALENNILGRFEAIVRGTQKASDNQTSNKED